MLDPKIIGLIIIVVADAPEVGANLHDHLGVYLTYACKDPITLYSLFRADRALLADAQLRVRGIDGLPIADASVMPSIIGGNTSAPCIMIGEKAADMILT